MGAKHQYIEIDLPRGYSSDVKEAIAAEIISAIRKRTLKGLDKDGDKFPGYSKMYVDSVDFKAAGKSKGDVNLTLSGDMLSAIDILGIRGTKVKIGFEKGTAENDKADGNIRGTYGSDRPNPKKARDFLGITDEELQKILNKYPQNPKGEARADAVKRAEKRIDKRLENVNLNELSNSEVDKFFELQIGEE